MIIHDIISTLNEFKTNVSNGNKSNDEISSELKKIFFGFFIYNKLLHHNDINDFNNINIIKNSINILSNEQTIDEINIFLQIIDDVILEKKNNEINLKFSYKIDYDILYNFLNDSDFKNFQNKKMEEMLKESIINLEELNNNKLLICKIKNDYDIE